MDIFISAISQGILWGLLSLGVFISFRILNIADMTTEGTFPLGAAICMTAISRGVSPLLATILAVCGGVLAGLVTGFLITTCRIPSLLAGILTMTGLLSINLRVMGRPNLTLLDKDTIFTPATQLVLPHHYDTILVGVFGVSLLIYLMFVFFKTELGQGLIATGDNPKMATSFGISTKKMTLLGLMLSNGIVALAGAIISQHNGYADVNSGLGVIVIALAAIIIGEVLFSKVSFLERLICTVYGSIIYRVLLVGVLKLQVIEANDFKLVSAILIALFLTMPHLRKKGQKGGV
ncbi:ABC transporter permease [Carnobacteriaceae bacterium zg-ZUI78]|nr:ABC transporter permease [Carnobacteriaceae bacterium zg-ZUI78]